MLELYKNIKKRRQELGLSQAELAKMVGYTDRSTIARIEAGKIDLPQSKILAIAKALDVAPGELMGWDEEIVATKPIHSSVAAGEPILMSDVTDEVTSYDDDDHIFIRAKGDSMYPTIQDGDTVVVEFTYDIRRQDVALVKVNGDEATIKHIQKVDDGIMLIGDNARAYSPQFYSNEQIEELPVEVVGKVVEIRRRLD